MHKPSNSNPCLIFSLILLLPPSFLINGVPTPHTLMYKYCSTPKLDDPAGMFSDTRQRLLQQLFSFSSNSKFYRTAVVPGDQAALWGHFQCRGDLTSEECHGCVNSLSNISSNSWCPDSLSARIQLYGCHIQYEADGNEIPTADLTHKVCGEESALAMGEGYQEGVRAAMEAVENGVMENPSGYCSVNFEGVYAVAQCAEGLRGCDCGECVEAAAGVATELCQRSVSGNVYTDLCFVSFEFLPEEGRRIDSNSNRGGIGASGKLVAIAAGVVALVAIGFILLKKPYKKDDDI